MTSTTWRGRKGAVLLGPTEDRVARYLADVTSRGRVTIRMVDLIARVGITRSEAYRVTARMRALGLFGIEDDQGGTNGGRRYWRTPTRHDGARLDPSRHRVAWARVLGEARARAARVAEFIRGGPLTGRVTQGQPGHPPDPAGPSFREMFAAAGGAGLLARWGVT